MYQFKFSLVRGIILRTLIISISLLTTSLLFSQNEELVYETSEVLPSFPGEKLALPYYLQEEIRYPEEARKAGLEGTVKVEFVVKYDGSIYNLKVLEGLGSGCDEEAIRLIKEGPKWIPGSQFGKTVNVMMTIPVKFKIGSRGIDQYNDVPPPEAEMEGEILMSVDVMPEFPGGYGAFVEYLKGSLIYPENAKQLGISGKVYVKFVVKKDGSIGDVQVLKGIGSGCDEEALRVIKESPNWKPGETMGKAVSVWYTVPVSFIL